MPGIEFEPILSNGHRRWQRLSIAFHSSRAISQASKKIVENKDAFINRLLLRSPSYRGIDIEPECFPGIDKLSLSKLVREKNSDHLNQYGGIQGLVSLLKTDVDKGIIESGAEAISLRRQTFGFNTIRMPSPKMSRIVLETFKDPILVLLFMTATLSLAFGIRREGIRGVSDGLSIFVSICLVIAAISFSNIWPTRQFHSLSRSNNQTFTLVIRNGTQQHTSVNDVVVGDLVCLQIGDKVPADGLFIDGNSFQVNESVLTTEANSVEITNGDNLFLVAGSQVTNGDARMLVTAVGRDTKWGEIMSSTYPTEDKTPLQLKLHKLTQNTAKIGVAVASLVLVILLIKYFKGNMKDDSGVPDYAATKGVLHICQAIIGILVTPIVIATAAIPEGLLLAATITLAYSTKRMAAENAVVQNLAACEAIGSITVICIDKSCAISSKSPQAVQFWLGKVNFMGKPTLIGSTVLQLMHEGIGLNTNPISSSETEKAICSWASQKLQMNIEQLKENCSMLDVESLNIHKKEGCIWIQRKSDNMVRIHMNGSVDEILTICSHYYEEDGRTKDICEYVREELKKIVQEMKNNGLHCIAYAHAAVSGDLDDNGVRHFYQGHNEANVTLIGFLGLKDLFRNNISKAVTECQEAGVYVKMITTENVQNARISALGCGIFNPNQIATTDDIIEGAEFRSFTDQERAEKAEKYNVIAGASPSDKLLLVKGLKQKGHIVGIIGGCPGDERLFEEAGVAFYLGIQESHSMTEKSDIIISDDSFTPIVKAMKWGRGIYSNIQIYAQFQLTATMASLVTDSVTTIFAREPPTINIVTAVSSGKIPFAALQILWVKLMVGTLVVLALSVDNPAESLTQQMPVDQREPFITNIMWRDIIGQALYQIIILLTIQFKRESTFKLTNREKDTMIFNIFVLCQIFTMFNTVKGQNIVEILRKNRLFWMVVGIIILLQVVIVELLKRFAGTERLNWKQWRACIGLAMISWLIGWLLRKIHVPPKPYFCFL
ncbi:hypothetical protein C2S51_021205 [Perilla frutescens var. frutescens]|nr:hypothetical protein C2S51_021205 [Perilla frutescens var. frutescens]